MTNIFTKSYSSSHYLHNQLHQNRDFDNLDGPWGTGGDTGQLLGWVECSSLELLYLNLPRTPVIK